MYRGLRVAVVVPAYNEERLIGPTLAGIPRWIDDVIVVDDDSCDQTAAAAAPYLSARVRLVRHTHNHGVGGAILTGYRAAHARGADVAVVMAGDGQMDPADLPNLLDPVVQGEADYVKGDRLSHPAVWHTMPVVRLLGNFALTHLTRLALDLPRLSDSQCGYTALRAAFIERLDFEALYPRYGFPNDLLSQLRLLGARVVDRTVRPIYGCERSGIRLPRVIPVLLFVLGRGWLRRARADRRAAHPVSPCA